MGGMKDRKFHSENYDSGHFFVSDGWMTSICLLVIGRDCVTHVHAAQVRGWRMITRTRDLILLDAEGFLKGAW